MPDKYQSHNITVLDARDAVRLRPALYFSKCFDEGSLDQLPFEIACHAFDECYDGNCDHISISVMPGAFTIQYNAGMSLEILHNDLSRAELIMTALFACRNHKKHLAVGDEFCELGMAIINFASKRCELTTVCKGKKGVFVFEEGKTVSGEITSCEEENEFTRIYLQPDESIFGALKLTYDGVKERAAKLMSKLKGLNMIVDSGI